MPLFLPTLGYSSPQSLTTAQVNQAFNNLKRQNVSFLLKWGIITAGISTVARTSNVATVVTNAAHGMIVGQKLSVNATTDNTFDASDVAVVAVPTTTSFTYASTGTDKAATADSGTLTTWEVVSDGTHGNWGNPRIQTISSGSIIVEFDALPASSKVLAGTIGNHSNSGRLVPAFGAIGLTTISFEFRQRMTLFGRAYWGGTTTGGGVTANANWTKEGDTGTASFDSGQNAMFISHSSLKLASLGSRGASSYPLPNLGTDHSAINAHLPNFQASPFTADAYRPSATGFYFQLYDASGTLMDQTALEALSPASRLQVTWSRTTDAIIDHTIPVSAITAWADVQFLVP